MPNIIFKITGSFAYPCHIRPIFTDSIGKICESALVFASASDPNIVIAFPFRNNAFPRIFDYFSVIHFIKCRHDPCFDAVAGNDDTNILVMGVSIADQVRKMVYVSFNRFAMIQTWELNWTRCATFRRFVTI